MIRLVQLLIFWAVMFIYGRLFKIISILIFFTILIYGSIIIIGGI